MSDAVMSESSPYRNSIKFYERMSDLQGELKNYETQEFQLEKEFERLWTEGINLESSSASADKEPPTLSEVRRGEELCNLTKSQILANLSNLNYYGKNEEVECRRRTSARNQMILDKLQELETNASIFAARSERLRMMRSEYESLVRKYASNRKRDYSEVKPTYYNSYQSQSFSSVIRPQKTGTVLISTGVNTDITGPIMSIRNESNIFRSSENIIEDSGRQPDKLLSNSNEGSSIDGFLKRNEPIYNKTTRPTFPDISTTSESEFVVPKLMQYPEDHFDDTSADTTSLSVLMPKHRGSNYLLNVTTDGSLSESTSAIPPHVLQSALKRNTINSHPEVRSDGGSTRAGDVNIGGNGKLLINSMSDALGKSSQENENACSSSSDSTSDSIGDSVMDSIQNKTPEFLPKDDSELLHIAEVDAEQDIVSYKDQHLQNENANLTNPTGLINELSSQKNQETWDNLSSSNLVRVAQKEIGIHYTEEPSDLNQKSGRRSNNYNEVGRNVDFDSKVKETLIKKGSSFGREMTLEDGSVLLTDDCNVTEDFLNPVANTLKLSFPATSSSSSSSSINAGENSSRKSPAVLEKVERRKADNPSDHELRKSGDDDEYAQPKTIQDNFPSQFVNPKNPNLVKPLASDPFLVTSQNQENKQTSKTSNSGNESKKLRLKFDYDDTESDVSDAIPINKQQEKPLIHQQPTKLNVQDDEFDGFFD